MQVSANNSDNSVIKPCVFDWDSVIDLLVIIQVIVNMHPFIDLMTSYWNINHCVSHDIRYICILNVVLQNLNVQIYFHINNILHANI